MPKLTAAAVVVGLALIATAATAQSTGDCQERYREEAKQINREHGRPAQVKNVGGTLWEAYAYYRDVGNT